MDATVPEVPSAEKIGRKHSLTIRKLAEAEMFIIILQNICLFHVFL